MTAVPLSRRNFIWSTLGGIGLAATSVHASHKPHFGIIGWGNRGSRYLEAVRTGRIGGVESLCDVDERRLRRGADALASVQRSAVTVARDYRRLLNSLRTPNVIVSAPFPQAAEIASTAIKQGKTVLLDSSGLFTGESAERAAEAFANHPGVYVTGLDPRWPTLATRSLFVYGSSRGAARVETHFWHPSWSVEHLRGGAFEILDALRHSTLGGPVVQPTFYAMRREPSPSARVLLAASGDGFQMNAELEITSGDAPEVGWERIDDFEAFARSSSAAKAKHWTEQYQGILAARQDQVSDC